MRPTPWSLWSPIVPPGLVTSIREAGAELGFTLVANEDFTERTSELISVAKSHMKMTGNDAFRMLQLLTHLKGHQHLTI